MVLERRNSSRDNQGYLHFGYRPRSKLTTSRNKSMMDTSVTENNNNLELN